MVTMQRGESEKGAEVWAPQPVRPLPRGLLPMDLVLTVQDRLADPLFDCRQMHVEFSGDVRLLHAVQAVQEKHLLGQDRQFGKRPVHGVQGLLATDSILRGPLLFDVDERFGLLIEMIPTSLRALVISCRVSRGIEQVRSDIVYRRSRIPAKYVLDYGLKQVGSRLGAAEPPEQVVFYLGAMKLNVVIESVRRHPAKLTRNESHLHLRNSDRAALD